jgi:hypothetical protein
LAALAGAGAAGTAFATLFAAHGTASVPRSDCVRIDRAGVMGGGTWRFCGADAVAFCREHAAEDKALTDRCETVRRSQT